MKTVIKWISLLLILCLMPMGALAQPIIMDNGQYGSVYAVLNLSTGESVLSMNTMLTKTGAPIQTPSCEGLLMKIGADGETIWTIRYERDPYNSNIFTDAIELDDGSIMAGLHQYNGRSVESSRYLLVHVSPDGKVLGEYPVEHDTLSSLGNAFLAADYSDDANAQTSHFFYYDENGTQQWEAELYKGTLQYRDGAAAVEGGSVFLGRVDAKDGEERTERNYGMVRMDKQGKRLWECKLGLNLKDNEQQSYRFIRLDKSGNALAVGSGYAYSGVLGEDSYEETDVWGVIASVNTETGKVNWEKRFPVSERSNSITLDGVMTDEGLVVIGTARTETQLVYYRFDENGELNKQWAEAKRNDDSYIRFARLMQLDGELWTVLDVELAEQCHLELNPAAKPE